jgi:hypothetical protein
MSGANARKKNEINENIFCKDDNNAVVVFLSTGTELAERQRKKQLYHNVILYNTQFLKIKSSVFIIFILKMYVKPSLFRIYK